jgi:MFS family permease
VATDTNTGWNPLGKPDRRRGQGGQSPFARMAVAHVLAMAGDTLVTMALAGSLFFSISPQAARGRVALYLLLTMAPFAVVAPFLGPVLDRTQAGRRLIFIAASASRAVICVSMANHLQSLWLFPEAFGVLVLSKAHMVTKSALVPSTVADDDELVTANSRLAVLSVLAGFAAAIPGVIVLKVGFLGGPWVVRLAAVVFAAAAIAAVRVPKPHRTAPAAVRERAEEELHAITVRMAATGMAVLRAAVGFLTFFVAFAFRSRGAPSWWFGVVLVSSLVGTLVGNVAAPPLRRFLVEERILLGGLLLVAVVGVFAGRTHGLVAYCLVAAATGVAAAAGKLAFDSIVQRDAPDAVRGRTFARFETRFQLVWVAGAFLPVVLKISTEVGIDIIALGCALAFFAYLGGIVSAKHRSEHFTSRLDSGEAAKNP